MKIKPKTIDQAVERLFSELPLKEKKDISNMAESDLFSLRFSLRLNIRKDFAYGAMKN